MFYRSPTVGYAGIFPYKDEVYYSTNQDPPYGMTLADDYADGIVGYVYPSAAPDRVPVYELSYSNPSYHIWSNGDISSWTKVSTITTISSDDEVGVSYRPASKISINVNSMDGKDTQIINSGTPTFKITITNEGDTSLDNISVTDTLFPACKRDWKAIKALMVAQGK